MQWKESTMIFKKSTMRYYKSTIIRLKKCLSYTYKERHSNQKYFSYKTICELPMMI